MSDLSVLDSLDLENVPEMVIVPAGEYEVKLTSCELEESKSTPGNYNIVMVMEIFEEPNAWPLYRYLSLPNDADSQKTFDAKRRFIKEAFDTFEMTKEDIGESAKGRTGWVLVGTRTYEGREQNDVKRFIVPA